MKYFKNSELVTLYKVSDKSVRNWIESARQGKIELELYQLEDKFYVADTLRNGPILNSLVAKGKKYRNNRSYRMVRPSPKFYATYNSAQILDIIASLENFQEFPHRLRFRNESAYHWDAYLAKLYEAGADNILSYTIDSLSINHEYLSSLLSHYLSVNVVDLGPGNGLAVKRFLGRLKQSGKLKKYIGIDPSIELLGTTNENIKKWFDGNVRTEFYPRNFGHETFADITLRNSYCSDRSINLILLLGGIILNFREPEVALQTIRRCMGKDDLFITSLKLDDKVARRFFDFNIVVDNGSKLPPHNKGPLDLLNIDESFYDVEQYYDDHQKARIIRIRLRLSLSIVFETEELHKVLHLDKGTCLLLIYIKHYEAEEIVDLYRRNHFNILQSTKSPDGRYLTLVATLDTGNTGRSI